MFETIEAGGDSTRLYVSGDFRSGARGVILFHPWWGLNEDVRAYADRLAGAGFAVVAPDLYRGRIAATIADAETLARALDEADADAIALAAVDRLAERLGPDAPLGAIGFSLGAAWSVWTPNRRPQLLASVVYYGTVSGPVLAGSDVPVMGHFAESDPYEPDTNVAAFEQGLRDAHREAALYRYPGTGHWFAEPSRDAYRAEAADLAFERTLAFLSERLVRR